MKDVPAQLAKNTDKAASMVDHAIALDRRYGEIGISAVAAAVRYQGAAKNTAYAPVTETWYERADEAA